VDRSFSAEIDHSGEQTATNGPSGTQLVKATLNGTIRATQRRRQFLLRVKEAYFHAAYMREGKSSATN